MTPIRALFFLAAITAACAGRIPSRVENTDSLETHIALLAKHRLNGNPIEDGIEKFKELVRKIKERVEQAENELIDALEASSTAVVNKINAFILKKTGVDLKLEERLEALEDKTAKCNSKFQTDLKQVIVEIKTATETCAASQVTDTKEIIAKISALVEILKVVPSKTINNIRACGAAPTTAAPEPEPTEAPTTAAPEPEPTAAPTTAAPEPEPTAAPEPVPTEIPDDDDDDDSGDSTPVPNSPRRLQRGRHSVRSLSDIWKKAKCVTKVLAEAAEELAEVPALVAKVVSDAADLASPESRKALEKCAEQSIAGKASRVQLAAAELAYCVIAPSQQ